MVWTISNKEGLNINSLIGKIMTVGKISRQEHLCLTSAILADDKISEKERLQINRVFDYIQTGRLNLVD